MAKFHFSLQAVLDHRQLKEEQAQREYAEAQARLAELQRRQDEARAIIAQTVATIRQRQMKGMIMEERLLYERWIEAQQGVIRQLAEQARRLSEEVEQRRLKLVRAVQDRTVMDKLREREREAYRQAENREELKLFDEIAVRDFIDARRQEQEKNAGDPERIAG